MRNPLGLTRILSLALLVAAAPAWAGIEDHGGEAVMKNGRYVLLDELAGYECRPGAEFAAGLAGWDPLLRSLDNVHWYLPRVYAAALDSVVVCTGSRVIDRCGKEDHTSYYVGVSNDRRVFAACRSGSTVRIRADIFEGLHPHRKALLLFHELTHGFAGKVEQDVLDFTSLVERNYQKPMTAASFGFQMRQLDLKLPTEAELFQRAREDLLIALNEDASRVSRIRAALAARPLAGSLLPGEARVLRRLLDFDFQLASAVTEDDIETVDLLVGPFNHTPNAVSGGQSMLNLAYHSGAIRVYARLLAHPDVVVDAGFVDDLVAERDLAEIRRLIETGKMDSAALRSRLWSALAETTDADRKEEKFIEFLGLDTGTPVIPVTELAFLAIDNRFAKALRLALAIDAASVSQAVLVNATGARSTAMTVAIEVGDGALTDALIAAKADLSFTDEVGNTYLHKAVMYDRLDIAKKLLAAGVSREAENRAGHTALEIARENKNKKMIRLLNQ